MPHGKHTIVSTEPLLQRQMQHTPNVTELAARWAADRFYATNVTLQLAESPIIPTYVTARIVPDPVLVPSCSAPATSEIKLSSRDASVYGVDVAMHVYIDQSRTSDLACPYSEGRFLVTESLPVPAGTATFPAVPPGPNTH